MSTPRKAHEPSPAGSAAGAPDEGRFAIDHYGMFSVVSTGLVTPERDGFFENWAGRPETESPLPRRGDSRSLPVICSCECTLTPAGPEPAEEAFADHLWHQAAAWINRPKRQNIVLYLERDVAHFF